MISAKSPAVYVWYVLLLVCITGCDRTVEGPVLLRYAPQVGQTYAYTVRYGHTAATMLRQIVSKDAHGYAEKAELKIEGDSQTRAYVVSDRYTSDATEIVDLHFPDKPVRAGDTWTGEIPLTFMRSFTHDTPAVKVIYELIQVKEGQNGRYCTIRCQPVQKEVALTMHMGQVGIKCGSDGKVVDVLREYDAFGKVQVGDRLVGINGQAVRTAGERNEFAQRFIESVKEDRTVRLTLLRGDRTIDVAVTKSIDRMGDLKVRFSDLYFRLETVFDVDRGLVLSQEEDVELYVTYPVAEMLPLLVDNIAGSDGLKRFAGQETYTRKSTVKWKISLGT